MYDANMHRQAKSEMHIFTFLVLCTSAWAQSEQLNVSRSQISPCTPALLLKCKGWYWSGEIWNSKCFGLMMILNVELSTEQSQASALKASYSLCISCLWTIALNALLLSTCVTVLLEWTQKHDSDQSNKDDCLRLKTGWVKTGRSVEEANKSK